MRNIEIVELLLDKGAKVSAVEKVTMVVCALWKIVQCAGTNLFKIAFAELKALINGMSSIWIYMNLQLFAVLYILKSLDITHVG